VPVRIAPCTLAVGLVIALAVGAGQAPGARAGSRSLFDLGDSLSVGTAPYLRARLSGYRIVALHDVGLHAYDAAAIVGARRTTLPPVLVVSAGTNDDPRIVATFWRSAARIVEAAGDERCVVWPTIVRPPAVGASYDGLNRALARLASRHRNLVLVDWVGMVRRHPSWLLSDGVHPGVPGYRARAAAIASAVASRCPA
jgi:hypothetical protein